MFEVKFGTPKPIMFREYCVYGDNILDIDLEARFAGKCEVSEYDSSRYGNDEEVSLFIKQSCSEILEKCLKNLPEKKSVVRSHFYGLDGLFSTELESRGITAKIELFSKKLTEDSESVYKDFQDSLKGMPTDYGWDHVNFDQVPSRPEGMYMVSPAFLGYKYKDDRVFYKPGEVVEVDYWAVATDTSYQVDVNAPDLKVDYGSSLHITFTMPDHDVNISIGATSVMTCNPNNTLYAPLDGFKGMMTMADPAKSAEPLNPHVARIFSDGSEWVCPACGTKNTGKFCYECGGVRPQNN